MIGLPTIGVLAIALVAVFLQSAFPWLRLLLGAQIDVLPILAVYSGLTSGPAGFAVVCVGGGLWLDSLSANPLGVTVLPLFAVALMVHAYKELLLHEQTNTQLFLGLGACGAVPMGTVVLLWALGAEPIVGWETLWSWVLVTTLGGLITPPLFRWLNWVHRCVASVPERTTSFRPDREIKRGRL